MKAPPPIKKSAGRRAGRTSGSKGPNRSRRSSLPFPVAGIGASAGGLDAFTQLLQNLRADTGMAFVLVQHLDPAHASALTQLLSRATSLPVHEVTNNLRVEANHVYVIPPNTCMAIHQGILKLRPRHEQGGKLHHSIDYFFESLAEDLGARAIGVVLSGTASDGTMGLEAIKAEGGITFAQDETAKYDSMPHSAVGAGCVDFVLSPERIAKELARIGKHPYLAGNGEHAKASERAQRGERESIPRSEARPSNGRTKETGFKKILSLLRSHSGVDFSLYKTSTIERRINRRIVLHKLGSLDAYAQFVRGNVRELDALYSDVLIHVTSFFRNPEAFDVLKRRVFPKLIPEGRDDPIRMWVPGCSTGQEAYSLAMAFTEFSDGATGVSNFQIFATDLSEAVLNQARAGLYARTLVHSVSPERLGRFFLEQDGGYRICKPLRDKVIFARQNLLSDPPFSRLHLVSCRNLLIYIEPGLQKSLLPIFHYALRPTGFLFLGASEGIGSCAGLFEPIDKNHRIYTKKATATPALQLHFPKKHPRAKKTALAPRPAGGPEKFDPELNVQREADRVTVKRHAPPGLLVNAELQVLQYRGETGAYLKTPTGRPTVDVLRMAREGLMLPLRAAFNRAKKENKLVRKENVAVVQNGETRRMNIEVSPLKNLKERCYLIFFEGCDASPAAAAGALLSGPQAAQVPAAAARRRIADLESELAEKDDYLHSIQENYEQAKQDRQSFSEEITSANEELQSTNEELETSKEELESNNEELTTVNEEVANRNTELIRLNSDLQNLQATLNMAIMVLARDLTIRSFTPLAERLFNLLASDVGRRLSDVRHNLEVSDLEEFIREVITSERGREREVQDKEGRWYSLRVRPYLTLDKKVDGAVLVLVDIDALKSTARDISEARDYAEAVTRTAPNPLIVLSAGLRVQTANEAFYHTFKIAPAEADGRLIYELGNGQWNIPRLRELLEDILPRQSFFNDLEVTHNFETIGRRVMLLNARTLKDASGKPARILLGIQDITELLHFQAALRASEERFRVLFALGPVAAYSCDAAGVIHEFNRRAVELWGREPAPGDTSEQFCGSVKLLRMDGSVMPHGESPMAEVLSGKVALVRDAEALIERPDRSRIAVIVNICALKNSSGEITGTINCFYDVTERRQAEDRLRRAMEFAETVMTNMGEGLYTVDGEGLVTFMNPAAEKLFGWTLDELRGKKMHEVTHYQHRDGTPFPAEECAGFHVLRESKVLNNHEDVFIRKDGTFFDVIYSACPIFPGGNIKGLVVVFRDTTQRKRAEDALEKAQALLTDHAGLLEQTVRERTAKLQETIGELEHFSYTITHDMRAPLRAMKGYGDMVLNEPSNRLTADSATYLNRVIAAAGRMDALIQDSLQYGKILSGEIELKLIEPIALLREIVDSYPTLQRPGVEIEIVEPLPPVVANEACLLQCFSNLLANAVKFVPPGTVPRVRVRAEVVATSGRERASAPEPGFGSEPPRFTLHAPGECRIRFWFEDNGIGIAPEYQKSIFGMFQQLDKSYEGTGVGLALVRKAAERMGGSVGVESEPGKGSRFWLELQPASN
jgi:two-component system CheB/CheR fusion protein